MNQKSAYNTIKSTVRSFLPDATVLLFGSRARGGYAKNSDYDLLIITKKTYPPREKLTWKTKIHYALVDTLEVPFDILLNSREEIAYKKELPGHIVRFAIKDAIEL